MSDAPATADLFDEHPDELVAVEPVFRDFGGLRSFCGPIATVKVFEDNALVRSTLEGSGHGRVLVVDGGGSLRRALVGDRLVQLAIDNAWAGIVVYGCIRDAATIASMRLGLKALASHPRKSDKTGAGSSEVPVVFGGARFEPGHWLYADADGIVIAPRRLH